MYVVSVLEQLITLLVAKIVPAMEHVVSLGYLMLDVPCVTLNITTSCRSGLLSSSAFDDTISFGCCV